MKALLVSLILILSLLQYRFWFGSDSILKVLALKKELSAQEREVQGLQQRNEQLLAKIVELKKYPAAIEEQARYVLGMVKQGEKYYQVVEPIE